jgi:hypothetical protein
VIVVESALDVLVGVGVLVVVLVVLVDVVVVVLVAVVGVLDFGAGAEFLDDFGSDFVTAGGDVWVVTWDLVGVVGVFVGVVDALVDVADVVCASSMDT